ncbi:carbohydrate ABC transporter permease [Streptomyces sp. NPDC050560]|uniref:carbohydrate ABC transporter permease n=1 Tax=Streptomyces sp. NPDC050560 TaxID=3365630 RepID=UPI00378E58BD
MTLASPARTAGRRGLGARARDEAAAAVFVGPNVVLYTVFVAVPALAGLALSFFEWDLIDAPAFVGFDNFSKMFVDPNVVPSLLVTVEFLVLGVIPTIIVGFLLAVLVNARMRGVGVVRVLYFIPLVVSAAVSSVLWGWLYQPQSGMLNSIIGVFGADPVPWLSRTAWALPALTIMIIWMSLPLVIILYLAALQRISDDLLDAARLDGAGPWTRARHILWPAVSHTTVLVVALEILNFIALPFEISLIMTQGGPLNSTMTLSLYSYRVAFEQGEVGYAAALSILQLLVIVIVALLARYIRRVIDRRGRNKA